MSPATLTSCILRGAIRPTNEFIWPFTGIGLNDDESFNIHGPKMQPMELAIPNAMASINSWTGGTVINTGDIHQHNPLIQINGDNNSDSAHKLRQAPRNLTQEFDADNKKLQRPLIRPEVTVCSMMYDPPPPTPPACHMAPIQSPMVTTTSASEKINSPTADPSEAPPKA